MKPVYLALVLSTALIAPAAAMPAAPAATSAPRGEAPAIGTYGFDVAGMDQAVAPGQDFFAYANGEWDRATAIPADKSMYGMFNVLDDLSISRTRGILETAATKPGSKIGDFYASFLDEAKVEARGMAPVKPALDGVVAARDRKALAAAMGAALREGVSSPFSYSIEQDDKAPDHYIVALRQSGLGLPDRDYYLKDDAALVRTRGDYETYLARMLTLAGQSDAAARARAVLAFETELARGQWSRIESRDADKVYNKLGWAELKAKAPGFDWDAWAEGVGKIPDAVLVAQPSAFVASAALIGRTPLPVIRDYALLRRLEMAAPYLSKAFVDADFAFYGVVLSGAPENQPRWRRGVVLVSDQMGEAVGQDYVARYFPPETKAAADALVRDIVAAMDRRLQQLSWMAPETKARARAKLASFRPKIGYPDHWRDYSALEIRRDDLYGNVVRAHVFEFQRKLNQLGGPVDRDEWFMTPMTINAYANPTMNEIVFPAAILQPPFFDPKADPAVNYGGIGAVIGHEISHHFDDQGRKYDPSGKLEEWWTPADVQRFTALTDRLVKQYDGYEPLSGFHVQGGLTLGENIADLAGLTVAHDAYILSLNGKPAPVIDGTTGDQRFYLGWAQVWRTKYREPNLRQRLLSDPHSPAQQRVATVRNLDPWYGAFRPRPDQALFLTPEERVRIW